MTLLLLWISCMHRHIDTPAPSAPGAPASAPALPPVTASSPEGARIVEAARSDERLFARLVELCDHHPGRLAGTEALAGAVRRTEGWMRADGQEGVRAEPVMVPVWVRGAESLEVIAPLPRPMGLMSLGGSVGGEVEAEVAVLDGMEALGPQVKGKIVLFNVPMAQTLPALHAYGEAVNYRVNGAAKAAAYGAVGVLVRSVTTRSLYTPHTGMLRYEEGGPQIPAAAIPTEEADWLARMSAAGEPVRLRMRLSAQTLPDRESGNVIGEITGSLTGSGADGPEIVVFGAHLDSWDVGQGAHDDGAGVVQVVEALRLIRSLGLRPRHTLRAVLYTNEENGLRGGTAYADAHRGEPHRAALESDLGGGWPLGWSSAGTAAQLAGFLPVAARTGLPRLRDGGGADISTLDGVLQIGLLPDDSRYFDVHHTHADTVDKVDPRSLREGLAATALLLWELAN